jgi:hypothetical protein
MQGSYIHVDGMSFPCPDCVRSGERIASINRLFEIPTKDADARLRAHRSGG